MCVFTECSVMPACRAISFELMPRATRSRISAWRFVMPMGACRDPIASRAHAHPQSTPTRTHATPRTDTDNGTAGTCVPAVMGDVSHALRALRHRGASG
jgi:hypothetical protein